MILTLDPGVDTGWSIFEEGKLAACGLGRPSLAEYGGPFAEVLIECEELRGRGEKNPNAILKMARTAGEHAGYFADRAKVVRYVRVAEWKGSTPKTICHARIWGRLDEWEKAIVDACFRAAKGRKGMPESKRHNVLDALGLGLWSVGRMGVGS